MWWLMIAAQAAAPGLVDGNGARRADPDVAARTALDADRAFAARAARDGTDRAAAAFADDDATLFVPQPVNALGWLEKRHGRAAPTRWTPTASWVACDGSYAIDIGEWRGQGGTGGRFATVWRKQPDQTGGWRWIVSSRSSGAGARTATSAAPTGTTAAPVTTVASCAGEPTAVPIEHSPRGVTTGGAAALDRTLRWRWSVDTAGARTFEAWVWDGRAYRRVVADREGARR